MMTTRTRIVAEARAFIGTPYRHQASLQGVGCDCCRDRFANGVNFRGFPHIPGNDFVIGYPVPGRG